jgi:hypothetical protein
MENTMAMEVQEVKDKLTSVIATLQELVEEFKSETTLGVLTQQVHAELNSSLRTVNVVLANVEEAEDVMNPLPAGKEIKDNLPKRAPSPASKVDRSRN